MNKFEYVYKLGQVEGLIQALTLLVDNDVCNQCPNISNIAVEIGKINKEL